MGNGAHAKTALIGFSGLGELVSDGEMEAAAIRADVAAYVSAKANKLQRKAGSIPWAFWQQNLAELWRSLLAVRLFRLMLTAMAILGIIGYVIQGDKANPGQATSPVGRATSVVSAPIHRDSPPPIPVDPYAELVPPVGTEVALATEQIRYCLAEGIRLDAMHAQFKQPSHGIVVRFNALVDDYNSRCSSFRYEGDTLDREKAGVELRRSALLIAGQERARQWLKAPQASGNGAIR
jgi:hypothetical protein